MFSIDGLVSGLDTTSIIEGLVSLQKSQVDRLNVKKSEILTEQAAFQGVEARLLSLKSSMSQLNRSTGSVFDQTTASSSDESILTVTSESKAIPGSYNVRVNSLARAHQIGSQGFSDPSTTISTGTISFQVGDRSATEITIDTSNNTVDGLVNAINTQSDDVSASIVYDQGNSAHRILLTSKYTGEANEINVTNNLITPTGSEVLPDFSGAAIQDATNAQLQLGSGAGAIVAEYDSNVIDGLIDNVTLNLESADASKDINLKVTRDTESAKIAIEGFVENYNSMIQYIDDQTAFNTSTNTASPLLGNRTVSTLKTTLSSMVTESVPGLSSSVNRFSQLGIDIDNGGKLIINSSELESALQGNTDGIEPTDIQRVFGMSGVSDNSGVSFLLGSTRTQASTSSYQVDILQSAERGSVTATSVLDASIVIDSSNNQIQLSIDSLETDTITLASGTYTQEELASHLQSRINGIDTRDFDDVDVSLESGFLEITSQRYGRSSEISAISGTASSILGFDGTETGVGQDVAGSFIVDGVVETATGTGRVLIGDSDNDNTADLQVRVTLTSGQVSGGVEANLNVSRGISSSLDKYFGELLDTSVGTIKTAEDNFTLRIESLDASIARVNSISESKTEDLIAQFTALERVLSDLQGTSSFLTSQLASL
ncbi:MAG: flagellar filament capping protein FliD [Planctomycetaceae bacterium]|nr:flagellar filament capping protein FliD [Planctomycetaceae bacterium]MCP4478109.1 flagellar filament capping protein FliD [Planctomycetaceae bacterium]